MFQISEKKTFTILIYNHKKTKDTFLLINQKQFKYIIYANS
jgi:hypothetical protein